MKILLIHQTFASPDDPGGTRHYELLLRARKAGWQPMVVTSDKSYQSGKQLVDSSEKSTGKDYNGVRVYRAYIHPNLHRSFVWRVLAYLSFTWMSFLTAWRIGKVDVVMGTSPSLFQPLSAWMISLLRRKPFLLEIRDLWPEFAIDLGVLRNPILIWLARRLEMFLYARATHLLVNSPAYRDYLIAKGISPKKISFIANGVEPAAFDPAEVGERFRKQHQLDGRFVVVYAGALGLANDISTVVDAATLLKDLPNVRIVLIGDGKERQNLEAQVNSLHLTNVIFAGALPKKDIPEALAAADVGLAVLQNIPMFTTTYPNKVFDYMAAGRATLLAIDGVIRIAVEKANAGLFVPPGNPQALAEAIRWCHNHPDELREMGRNGRRCVEQDFNRELQAQQFVELIQRISRTRRGNIAEGSDPGLVDRSSSVVQFSTSKSRLLALKPQSLAQ